METKIKLTQPIPTFLRYGDFIINASRIEAVGFNRTYGAKIMVIGRQQPYHVPNEVAELWFKGIIDYKKVLEGKGDV